jgi:hypothetical protein
VTAGQLAKLLSVGPASRNASNYRQPILISLADALAAGKLYNELRESMVAHDERDAAAQIAFVQREFTSARHIMSPMACSVYQIPPMPKPTSMEALVLLTILSMKCGGRPMDWAKVSVTGGRALVGGSDKTSPPKVIAPAVFIDSLVSPAELVLAGSRLSEGAPSLLPCPTQVFSGGQTRAQRKGYVGLLNELEELILPERRSSEKMLYTIVEVLRLAVAHPDGVPLNFQSARELMSETGMGSKAVLMLDRGGAI